MAPGPRLCAPAAPTRPPGVCFNHSMYYANAEQLSNQVLSLSNATQPPIVWFATDADAVGDIDFTAGATLRSLNAVLIAKGIQLVFVSAENSVVKQLDRYGLERSSYYHTIEELIAAFENKNRAQSSKSAKSEMHVDKSGPVSDHQGSPTSTPGHGDELAKVSKHGLKR